MLLIECQSIQVQRIQWSLNGVCWLSACSFNSFLLPGITFKNRVCILCMLLDSRSKTVSASCACCFCSLVMRAIYKASSEKSLSVVSLSFAGNSGAHWWEPLRALSLDQRHRTSPSIASAWTPHPPCGLCSAAVAWRLCEAPTPHQLHTKPQPVWIQSHAAAAGCAWPEAERACHDGVNSELPHKSPQILLR